MSRNKAKSESVTTRPPTTLGMASVKEAAEPPAQPPGKSASDMKLDSLRMTSVKKAAEIFGVSVTTVWNWIASGRLKAVKVGGRRLIAIREVSRVLEAK